MKIDYWQKKYIIYCFYSVIFIQTVYILILWHLDEEIYVIIINFGFLLFYICSFFGYLYNFFHKSTLPYISIYLIMGMVFNHFFTSSKSNLSLENLSKFALFSILSAVYFLFLFIYFKNKISPAQYKYHDRKYLEDIVVKEKNNLNEKSRDLLIQKIYEQIIELFEQEKPPYLDSNFSSSKLAELLDTNVTYISKAINSQSGLNFNLLVNQYRIGYVKKLLEKEEYNRYKMTYLYLQAGFTNQSTFNKAFKQIEKITPSQYINQKKHISRV